MSNHLVRHEQGQRLTQARIARGFKSPSAAARYFGWKEATYGQHERGTRGIQRVAGRYAKALRCSVGWLLTGEGTPPARSARQATDALDHSSDDPNAQIREFDLHDGASYGSVVLTEWTLPMAWLRDELKLSAETTDIIAIDGISMVPDLGDGDRVLIDRRSRDPHQGGLFAVRDGASIIVKHVELIREPGPTRIRCVSSNMTYRPFELTLDGEQVEIIGRVAARISRL